MERILALYALPYDPHYPVICYDERPCFLIGDTLVPAAMQPGKPRKQHYEYEKLGSCALLAAIEPLTGKRLAQVHPQRTKREYTLFCQALTAQYPNAIKIRLVQDNLNTHNASAFYEHLPAEDAFALAERFEFIYTPQVGLLAQYDRVRVRSDLAPLPQQAHSIDPDLGPGGVGLVQRAQRQGDQDQLAVLHPGRSNQAQ
jgi:hypothetical protein